MNTNKVIKCTHKIQFIINKVSSPTAVPQWEISFIGYASICPLNLGEAKELSGARTGNVIIEELYRFRMRKPDFKLNEQFRIVFEDETYSIKRIINDYWYRGWIDIIAIRIDRN